MKTLSLHGVEELLYSTDILWSFYTLTQIS